jgi:nucleoside-diphosphate-sugar epimerase
MMSVLITGGAGYVGSVLTRELLERGFAVTVLDNFRFGQTGLLGCCHHESLRILRGDCRDERVVVEALRDADIVIPLAAVVGAPLCARDRVGAETINLGAIRMLLTKLSRGQRLLFPATNSGYGIGEKEAVCTEDSPLKPISLYGVTKAEAEKAVLDRGDAITFRFATAFGISPRMRLDLLVNDFVWRAVTDRAVVVFEGHFRRNFIHVRDMVKGFLHGIEHFDAMKGRPYNLGLEAANLTKLELCAEIRKVIPGFTALEAPVGEDPDKRDYVVSNARILATGFRPEWSLERGIRELVRGYEILGSGSHANAR